MILLLWEITKFSARLVAYRHSTQRKIGMAETRYADRTESIARKHELLGHAYATGHLDLALSLAESIRDTLYLERQQREGSPSAINADAWSETAALPGDWAAWAAGWSYYKSISLVEEFGIDRRGEPVDIALSFPEHQVSDLRRELRVARVAEGRLCQIPSQVYDDRYGDAQRHIRLVFLAEVAANQCSTYLVFYGNPHAELPAYITDLKTHGQEYALRIDNNHFSAQLSAQTGQLERLVLKRGLEIFAGGEGHGEPPHIDWAHDYLASANFQKFRVTNWAQCPDWEVVRGPLCTKVRRWGFPHSPVHPLFAPARMHIDVTYTFYADQPYFLKRGQMEMVQDFELNYLRDDEWVFSGYPFSESVWMDREGRLHEGAVTPGQEDDLWATGFFNDKSKDAFIALWLEHSAEGFEKLCHSGAAAIDYQGHGQLWSRWAARDNPQFKRGDKLNQYNAYWVAPYAGPGPVEELRRRLLAPLVVRPGAIPALKAPGRGRLARVGETMEAGLRKEVLWDALREVVDDMFYTADSNLVDMGYIRDLRIEDETVYVLMTMPHRGRPKYMYLGYPLRERLLQLDGVREVVVDCTWDPAWDVGSLTPQGRREMGLE